MKKIKDKKRGFSLVELIVVIAIIGILAAIAVPKYSEYKKNANISADRLTAKLIADATIMAIEAGEVSEAVKVKEESDADWSDITNYISDTTIKYDSSKKWRVFTVNNTLYVCAGSTTEEAVKQTWDNSTIKVETKY